MSKNKNELKLSELENIIHRIYNRYDLSEYQIARITREFFNTLLQGLLSKKTLHIKNLFKNIKIDVIESKTGKKTVKIKNTTSKLFKNGKK